jgi:hypothetical protein
LNRSAETSLLSLPRHSRTVTSPPSRPRTGSRATSRTSSDRGVDRRHKGILGPQARYKGRPFLRLIECYVLLSIGELDDDAQIALASIEPRLGEVYGMSASWDQIVSSQMEFPSELPDRLRSEWARARAAGLDPLRFAQIAADQLIR